MSHICPTCGQPVGCLQQLVHDLNEPYVMKPSEEAAFFKAVTQRPVEGVVCGSELERQIQSARKVIDGWPPDVKAAMGIAVETSAIQDVCVQCGRSGGHHDLQCPTAYRVEQP